MKKLFIPTSTLVLAAFTFKAPMTYSFDLPTPKSGAPLIRPKLIN